MIFDFGDFRLHRIQIFFLLYRLKTFAQANPHLNFIYYISQPSPLWLRNPPRRFIAPDQLVRAQIFVFLFHPGFFPKKTPKRLRIVARRNI